MGVAPRAGRRPRARQLRSERDYRVDGGSAGPPSGSASTALGPQPPPLPFLDFDGSLAVSETSSRVAPRSPSCWTVPSATPAPARARGSWCDGRFHRLALQHPDILGARGKRLAHL